MPWHVEREGDGYVVRKGHSGKKGAVVGKHSTRAKALAHLRALYANAGSEARGGRG